MRTVLLGHTVIPRDRAQLQRLVMQVQKLRGNLINSYFEFDCSLFFFKFSMVAFGYVLVV